MLDDDIQQELVNGTVESDRPFNSAVNMEMGQQNQQQNSSNKTNGLNAVQRLLNFASRIHDHSRETKFTSIANPKKMQKL